MTREQFNESIIDYLNKTYNVNINFKELGHRQSIFNLVYEKYCQFKDEENFKDVLYIIRSDVALFLQLYRPTKEQFKEEVRIRLYNNPRCVGKKDKIDRLLNEDVDNILEDNYDNAINEYGFFHGVNDAAYEFRICYF